VAGSERNGEGRTASREQKRFLALRIAVIERMEELRAVSFSGPRHNESRGAVRTVFGRITSREDRIVKKAFREAPSKDAEDLDENM